MKRISISNLAMECGTGCYGSSSPFIISPDTEDTALAMEHLAIAFENVADGLNLDGDVESIILKMNERDGVSTEDYGNAAKYGAIAAIIAAIVAAIAWAIKKLKGDSATTSSGLSTIQSNAQQIAKLDVPDATPEYLAFKQELWTHHAKGFFGVRIANRQAWLDAKSAYFAFTEAALSSMNSNQSAYLAAIEASTKYNETMDVYMVPSNVVSTFYDALGKLGKVVGAKDHQVVIPEGKDEEFRLQSNYSQLLHGCDEVIRAVVAYQPAFSSTDLDFMVGKNFIEDISVEQIEENIKTNDKFMTELGKLEKALTSKMKSVKLKLNNNNSARTSLKSTLVLIKLLLNYHNWSLQDLEYTKAMQRKYLAFSSKSKTEDKK